MINTGANSAPELEPSSKSGLDDTQCRKIEAGYTVLIMDREKDKRFDDLSRYLS
jgi:hypothetical protein